MPTRDQLRRTASLRPEAFATLAMVAAALKMTPTAVLESAIYRDAAALGIAPVPRAVAVTLIRKVTRRTRAGGVWTF